MNAKYEFPPNRKNFKTEQEYALAYTKWSDGKTVPQCPQCSSLKIIYYLYGLPGKEPEMLAMELGYYRVELMGCEPRPPWGKGSISFDHECNDCKFKWLVEDTDLDNEEDDI